VAPQASSAENEGPDRSLYDNGVGDSRGWYKDGAYTAAPRQDSSPDPLEDEGSEQPQAIYYRLLMHRFGLLRRSMKRTPPRSVLEKLDSDHRFHMSPAAKDYKLWHWRLQKTDPILAQLAAMDKATVLRLIKLILKGSFLRKGRDRTGALGMIRTSMWIWGLLARLPDRGELVSEEVGSVRELGKEAVWVGMQVRGMDVESLKWQDEGNEDDDAYGEEDIVDVEVDLADEESGMLDGDFEDDDDVEDGEVILNEAPQTNGNTKEGKQQKDPPVPLNPDRTGATSEDASGTSQDLAAAKTRLLARLDEPAIETEPQTPPDENVSRQNSALNDGPRNSTRNDGRNDEEPKGGNEDHAEALLNIRTTIDMIITVAGDMYGQRDLLQFRKLWAEEANGELLET
jgi:Survival motor neuron (SMN) interacting protein 1 (SIP1)